LGTPCFCRSIERAILSSRRHIASLALIVIKMKSRVVRFRWPLSLDAMLAAALIMECSAEQGIPVQCFAGNTLLEEEEQGAEYHGNDELYLLDYGCLLSVSYLAHCCAHYGAVHIYDNHRAERQIPAARDNLSVHNVIGVATCSLVARDFGYALNATQQSLFAYVEDSLVLHTMLLPCEREFRRGAEEMLESLQLADRAVLALEPASLIERGKAAMLEDERQAQELRQSEMRTLGKPSVARLIEITHGHGQHRRRHIALPTLVTALLYHESERTHALPLIVALHMGSSSSASTPPYVLLRALEDERSAKAWELLALPPGKTMQCAEWDAIKAKHLY
jgi:hypothetical protein